MKWGIAIVLGFVLWFCLFGITSFLWYLNILGVFGIRALLALFFGLVAYLAASITHPGSFRCAISCGLIWFAMVILLDFLITLKMNPDLFKSEFQWLGYLLIIIFPVMAIDKTGEHSDVSSLTVE